jgi:hypothetical protein
VPKIMAAPAYQDCGLVVITFDEGTDSAACCGEASEFGPDDPNVPLLGVLHRRRAGNARASGAGRVPAAAVDMSRVVNGVHYPSDIAGGWAVGVGVGMLTLRWWPLRQSQPAPASAA